MRMPKSGPGEGPQKTRDTFTHWKGIEGGERHFAYVAGDCHWIIGHPSDKGSKPCLTWATKGALPCRFCHAGKCPCEFGYLPVYRAVDYRPMFVIVYGEEREWVERCKLHNRVQIGREVEKGARLWVRLAMVTEPAFATTINYRKCAQDIEDSLLAVWGIPELVSYLRCAASDNAVSQPKAKPAPVAPPNGDSIVDAVPPVRPTKEGTGRAKKVPYDEVLRRLKERGAAVEPSTNGTHAPE